jgi:putative peptidoglycan lipid II flippase
VVKLIFSLSSLSFVGYAIGFVNQIIIANQFGTSAELDIYLLALSVVNFGWFFIGPINEISIPDLFKHTKLSNEDGSLYFSKILNIILLFSIVMSSIIYLFLPYIFDLVSSGTSIDYLQFRENILFLLPIIFLSAITQYFQVVLNSMSKYIAQSIGKVVTASISVLFLLLFFDYFGIKAIIFGMELGLVVLALLQFYFIFKLNIYYKPFGGIIADKKYYKHVSALSFTYLLSALQLVYERFVFISFGDGVLSSYNYSQALLQVPQMIVVTGVVAIAWTNFMNRIYENDVGKGLDELFQITLNSFTIAMYITLTISIYSKEIIYLLFYHGEFDDNSLNKTSLLLKYIILSMPFLVISNLLGRAIISLKNIKIVVYINFVNFSISMMILYLAYHYDNILLATITLLIAQFTIVLIQMYYLISRYNYNYININIIKIMLLNFFSIVCVFLLFNFISIDLTQPKAITLLLLLICFGFSCLLSLSLIKLYKYLTRSEV